MVNTVAFVTLVAYIPVRLVQDDKLVPSWRKCNFLLRKSFDSVSYHVYASFVTGIQLEDCLLVCIAQQRSC